MAESKAEQLLRQALEAGIARDYRGACSILGRIIAGGDGVGEEGSEGADARREAFLYLGRSHQSLGELGRAIDAFRAYLRAGGDEAKGRFFLGRAYLAGGLFSEATRALRKSVEVDPSKASTWALLGAAELKLRKSGAAVAHLEKAVGLAPHDRRIYRGYLNALLVRGIRDFLRGDSELAAQTFGFIADNGLDSTALRLWRARSLRELGRHAEALVECEAAASQSPDDPSISWLRAGILLDLGRKKEALDLAKSLGLPGLEGRQGPGDRLSLDMLRAGDAFKKGDWKMAASAALSAIHEAGTLPPSALAGLHAMAAESLRMTGNAARASEEARKAVEADPRSPELGLNLAFALFDLDRHEEALAEITRDRGLGADGGECDFLEALCSSKLGRRNDWALDVLQQRLHRDSRAGIAPDKRHLLALGECLYRAERPDLALPWFEKVLSIDPGNELALLYRISVGESLADPNLLRQASDDYLERFPDNMAIRKDFAENLVGSGDWARVADLLEEGLPWAGASTGYRRILARAYRETSRWREGAVLYRDLLLAEPGEGELLMALCLCLHHEGRSAFAWTLLDRAPEAALKRAGPWVVKGMLSEKLGKAESAFDAYRRAVEIEPGIERPWRELARIYEDKGLYASAQEARERAAAALPKGDIPKPIKPSRSEKKTAT